MFSDNIKLINSNGKNVHTSVIANASVSGAFTLINDRYINENRVKVGFLGVFLAN